MNVRVTGFARIREILGGGTVERELPDGATVAQCFSALGSEFPALAALEASTRFVRGNAFVDGASTLHDGDELGLLPPYGGG